MAKVAHYESSSDEAPEEETFSVSQLKTQKKAAELKKTLDKSNAVHKQKRRERDSQFKAQKKKLLSEILADLPNAVEEEPQQPRIKVVQHKKKKLETEKDGFKVKVVKKSKSSLPPVSSSLLRNKEEFLRRKRE